VELYAAYATNMDPSLMAERCPHSPMRGNGWLEGAPDPRTEATAEGH